MEFLPPREYSASELEAIATKFHQRYCGDPIEVPIDIELILEKDIGAEILPFPGLEREYGINGIVVKHIAKDRVIIYVDEAMMENQEARYRFTLAEEYAHNVLHADLFQEVQNLEEFLKLRNSLTDEEIWLMDRNARYLVGCILIPASHVSIFAKEYLPSELDPVKHLLVKVSREEVFRIAAQILHRFYNVSEACMRHRINNQAIRLDKWLLQQYR